MCIIGFNTRRVPLEEDLTVNIDYDQYQRKHYTLRGPRQATNQLSDDNLNSAMPLRDFPSQPDFSQPNHPFPVQVAYPAPNHQECDEDDENCHVDVHKVCADPEREVYQKCGSKCVLGCRYASTSSGITISKHDCEKNDCVEGCFCKTGLVRHQSKCIPALECPIRKCHNRDEVYVCK